MQGIRLVRMPSFFIYQRIEEKSRETNHDLFLPFYICTWRIEQKKPSRLVCNHTYKTLARHKGVKIP